MSLKQLALRAYQEQQAEGEQDRRRETAANARLAARKFETVFGFPPDEIDEESGAVLHDGLTFKADSHQGHAGLTLQITCPDCGKFFFGESWLLDLADLGRALSARPYHSYCSARRQELAAERSTAEQLADLIRQIAREEHY
jgi:hypothetical protein